MAGFVFPPPCRFERARQWAIRIFGEYLLPRFLILALCALTALPAVLAGAAIPETTALLKGADYIRTQQQADGSYSGTLEQTMDAVFAMRAAGFDPAKETTGTVGPADFLKAKIPAETRVPVLAKSALVAKAFGLDPKAVGGVDLIAKTNAAYDPAKGTYAADDFSQSVIMLGLACTGNTVPGAAAAALKANQLAESGGWGFGGFPDPDTTAIAVQALLATGTAKSDAPVTKAVAYFHANQGDDGGWGFDPTESNASSTAYVVQALLALGENPEAPAWQKGGVSPVAYLLSQQQADGSFKGFDPAFATNQAVPALAGRTFCNAPETPITRTRPVPTATPTATATRPVPTATSTSAPASPTAAPRPPATGTGAVPADGANAAMLVGGLALFAGALLLVPLVRERRG